MLIDLTCPAEVFRTALPTEEMPAASLALYNLSDRVIVSVEVTLRLLSGSGAEKERVVFRGRALNGRPHSTFQMNVPCTPDPAARRAEATIDKVWFSDNAVWRREASTSVEYIPNELPVSPALTDLKFTAGETAVGFPSQQEGLWVCVCGRPNPDGQDVCARCRRSKELIFTRYNREAVEKQVNQRERQLDLNTRSVREDTARLQRIREAEYNRKLARKARRKRLALCLPLLAAVLAAVYFFGGPALRLWAADRAMAREEWSSAAGTLREILPFPGAESRLKECEWQEALSLNAGAETREELKAASDALRAVEGREESIPLAEEADLKRARLALEAKDTAAAREAIALLKPEDERRVSLEKEILFAEAKALYADEKYDKAREAFLQVASVYPEAAEFATECIYLPACQMINNGEYEAAIFELNRIPEHPQSRTAIQECHYRIAEQALEQEDLETAAAEFLMAADYGDAPARTEQTVFALAEKAYGEGDLAKAQSLYGSLPGYAPAVEKNNECLLKLARQAIHEKEYDRAMTLLDALPAEDPEAAELIPRTAYLAGTAALRAKDYAKAMTLLERAGDYRDAESKLSGAIEALVNEKLSEGDAAGALELLPRIENSKNYKQLNREAEYQDAVARAEAGGDPVVLRKQFEELGNYKESRTWIKRTYYQEARTAEDQQEELAAARLYEKAGDWNDAEQKAAALFDEYYGAAASLAREAVKNEEYQTAVTLLETLDRTELPESYKDLNTLYEDACVKAGEALYQAGRPYEAAVYFRLANNPRRTARYLNYACYKILGKWNDRQGNQVAEFREDSTCDIDGESFTFLVSDSYTILIQTDEGMIQGFRITELNDYALSLRDLRPGRADHAWSSLRRAPEEAETAGAEGSGT